MKTSIFILAFLFSMSSFAEASLRTFRYEPKLGLSLRVGEVLPKGMPKGDIFYFHGFGDRLDNHMPLFTAWASEGFRVLSFDFPSHGETSGIFNNIDLYSFEEIIGFAEEIERGQRSFDSRPLILAGWSTGGLMATRAVQLDRFSERSIKGLILFAPAISVPVLVGKKGVVTQETLTSNLYPPHMGPIAPISPLLKPLFAVKLLKNAFKASHGSIPVSIPSLVIVGGVAEDKYVQTENVVDWSRRQSLKGQFQCDGAFHELDNEPAEVGREVRELAATFASDAIANKIPFKAKSATACRPF